MKTLFKFFLLSYICLMCVACDTPTVLAMVHLKSHYVFYFFQFSNPEYEHHIIAKLDTLDGKRRIILPSTFPRRDLYDKYYSLENKYLYIDKKHDLPLCNTDGVMQEMEKTNLCDLSQGSRLIALEDGYYTWYPFTAIPVKEKNTRRVHWWKSYKEEWELSVMPPVVLSARWEDICTFDRDTVHIISKNPYSQVHCLDGMYQYTRGMSFDELMDTINRLIKEKDFAHGGHESFPWFK